MNKSLNKGPSTTGDTHRNFKNLQSSQVSMQSSSNYQNIIDLSKAKRTAFKPKNCGEILLPTSFYKLHTSANTNQTSDSIQDLGSSSVF